MATEDSTGVFVAIYQLDQQLQSRLKLITNFIVEKSWISRHRTEGKRQPKGTFEDYHDLFVITGSVAEGMVTSRLFKDPTRSLCMEVELDMMVMFADVNDDLGHALELCISPVSGQPGFYTVDRKHLTFLLSTSRQDDIEAYICKHFGREFFASYSSSDTLNGALIKNAVQELIQFQDKSDFIRKCAATLFGEGNFNVIHHSEYNGPAVTLNFDLNKDTNPYYKPRWT